MTPVLIACCLLVTASAAAVLSGSARRIRSAVDSVRTGTHHVGFHHELRLDARRLGAALDDRSDR
ncbi:MAG: hypothetical protein KGR17_08770 [Acidobacteria bacterium]|nr:hypothetical protein [Acidobacteriota bacterium]